ncbi:MAG: hypothetical protein ACLFR1_08810 [Spirochaetia bacterium]
MLVENKGVRQIPGEGFRRWFTEQDMDLVVWYTDTSQEKINGFQLCYDKTGYERCLTWREGEKYAHDRVDSGEFPFSAKMSPVLMQDGYFASSEVADQFLTKAENIEEDLRNFVYDKLAAFPDHYNEGKSGIPNIN